MNSPDKLKLSGDVHVRVDHEAAVISNTNTTIGYATFSKAHGTLDYILVNPAYRRMGFGSMLLALCERDSGGRLLPATPISPLGRQFFTAIGLDIEAI